MNIKEHHLYTIENKNISYYLYILKKIKSIQSKNIVDTLAIRSDYYFMDWDVSFGALPLCSKAIFYKKDLGYPTIELLMDIDPDFCNVILAAEITNELRIDSYVISFILEHISSYYDNMNIRYAIAAALNRKLHNSRRGIARYVTDRINQSNYM